VYARNRGEPHTAGDLTAGSSCGETGSTGILEPHRPPLKDLRDLRGSIRSLAYLFFLGFAFGFLFASLTAAPGLKGCPQGAVAMVTVAPHILHFAIATFLLNYQSTSRLVFAQ
jgi:hypothetical protein